MASRKKSKKLDLNRIDEIASMEPPKSYQSLLYGVLTVIVFFVLIFLGLKVINQRNAGEISDQGARTQSIYIVKKGDSLWTIALSQYQDGYKWVDIAKANNLSDPGKIESGMKLVIPAINMAIAITEVPSLTVAPPTSTPIPTRIPTKVPAPTSTPTLTPPADTTVVSMDEKINGNSYTVATGDNLWNIAVRAYGDGYKWVEIAKVNKLANPDIIHSGNKFTLPR